jgi:hypothetical protein
VRVEKEGANAQEKRISSNDATALLLNGLDERRCLPWQLLLSAAQVACHPNCCVPSCISHMWMHTHKLISLTMAGNLTTMAASAVTRAVC